MIKLNDYINESDKCRTCQQLHNVFNNPELDQNDTIIKLIDKYCAEGGEVLYECQDNIMANIVDEYKVESAIVQVPQTDIIFNIDVYKMMNAENAYCIYIQGETLIIIIGKPMKSLKENLELAKAINEAEESEIYKYLSSVLKESIETGKPVDDCIDEGIFGALFGGIAGATAGPAVMKAFCKVLGIDERGTLGSLLTSRAVLAAMGGTLGWKI